MTIVYFSAEYGGSYSNAPVVQPTQSLSPEFAGNCMPSAILTAISLQTPPDVVVEILNDARFFGSLARRTNHLNDSIELLRVICKAAKAPLEENVRYLCDRVLATKGFWNQIEKHLDKSTTKPSTKKAKKQKKKQSPAPKISEPKQKDAQVLWELAIELCQMFAGRRSKLDKSFLKNMLELAENNTYTSYTIDVDGIRNILRDQESLSNPDAGPLDIYPTLHELKEKKEPEAPLSPNIIRGKYRNVAHYLNVHLALFREDFVSPLRVGIQKIIKEHAEGKEIQSNDNVQVYPNVKIQIRKTETKRRGEIFSSENIAVDLVAKVRETGGDVGQYANIKHSRRLLFGSLLCISTSAKFEDLIIAIVCSTPDDVLSQGYVRSIRHRLNQPIKLI